ncbi:MAG: NAD(P)H-hydrate epimerase, partial [Phycisphaerae bacterium]|nr:NAD(P)H-hydrate epimerase [Phycisphaerae bacterium]
MDSLTRQEVRAVDRAAIEELGIPGLILMENAGRNCADAIEEFLGDMADARVAIVAGVGNNGGDGYVIARHLAMRGFGV